MTKLITLLSIFFMACAVGFSQGTPQSYTFEVRGSVKGKENGEPIFGVIVTTTSGGYAVTNSLGEYKIKAIVGDYIRFESSSFLTKEHRITNNEDVDVLVQDYKEDAEWTSRSNAKSSLLSKNLIDSAYYYKTTNIDKSIDFVTKAITEIGPRGNKIALAKAYTTLGEIYQYYKQYDLAIKAFKEALGSDKTTRTELLLAKNYLLSKEFLSAEAVFNTIVRKKGITVNEKIEAYEGLGDAFKGLANSKKAIDNYKEGLELAETNKFVAKITDLNSKIADAFVAENNLAKANLYYGNSLSLSNKQTPQRAIQEKEKVADFYNSQNQFDKEIVLRKKSLEDLEQLRTPTTRMASNKNIGVNSDSISSQRIKYKIGSSYLSQSKFDEAIPFLEESIKEANEDKDLIVQKDATRKLSEVFEYKGDFSKAYETYQKYVALVDTLYIRKEQEISQAARFNREITAKQNRISGLEKERELFQSKFDLALTSEQLVERQKWLIYSLIFGILLLGLTSYFFYRSNKQQKLANNLLALKSLRSQMNPHFIFNALNSVNNYIAKSDERSANRYLSEFSTLMRAVLENSEEDFIPLSKEIELIELYTKLEHSRFPDKFTYEIQVEENIDIAAYAIPPMLLQPYIENAIWHGLRYKEKKGFLKINLTSKAKDSIEIVIIDNGVGRQKSAELKTTHQKKQKSKGMGNIKKRIDILNDMYKDKVAVFISDYQPDGTGTKVVFTLKK